MGFFSSDHIKEFCKGQKIREVETSGETTFLRFSSGESLLIYPKYGLHSAGMNYQVYCEIITSPIAKNGEVKMLNKEGKW